MRVMGVDGAPGGWVGAVTDFACLRLLYRTTLHELFEAAERPEVVAIDMPIGLLDDGPRKFVFIAQNENLTQLQRREVRVVRRTAGSVLLRGVAKNGVAPGERVLTSGVVELLSVLNDLAPPEPVRDEDPV